MMADYFCIKTVVLEVLEYKYCEIGDRQYNLFTCQLTFGPLKSMRLWSILFLVLQTAAM